MPGISRSQGGIRTVVS